MIQAAFLMLALTVDDARVALREPLRQVVYRDETTHRNVWLDVVEVGADRSTTVVIDAGAGRRVLGLHPDCSLTVRGHDEAISAVETTVAALFALGAQNMTGIDPGETWHEYASDHESVYHAGRKVGQVLHLTWTRTAIDDGGTVRADVDYDVRDVVPTLIRMREGNGTRHTLRLVADSQQEPN